MSEDEIQVATPEEVEQHRQRVLAMNRKERRSFRRAILADHRNGTRFWRRAWRGVIPQWQVAAIVRSAQKRYARIDAQYGVTG